MTNDELREAIRKAGVRKVATQARIAPTTLYSFCTRDLDRRTQDLTSENKAAVIAALAFLRGEPEVDTAEIVDLWTRKLDDEARREVLDFARFKSSQSD
jgi:hypothetical protein